MTYDAVGNIVTRAGKTYTYNAANRLAAVDDNGQPLASYQHNGKGERVIKTAGGTTTHFIYDLMGNIIAEADITGVVEREYAYANGERLALIDTTTGSLYFYHNDHLATPKALTDELGAIVWQADYTPFGELTETVSIVEQPFRFPGQYFDGETGLYYNYFRDYNPSLGRYVQSDPIGLEGGLNTYSYVANNPTKYIDPTGEVLLEPVLAGFGTDAALPEPSDAAWPKWVGWGIVIGGAWAIDKVVDMCMSDEEDDSCEALYQSILQTTCAGLTGRKKFRCFEAARIARDQCYQER